MIASARPLPGLIPYRQGNYWGYADSTGAIRIAPQWEEATFFYEGKAVVRNAGNSGISYSLIDTTGNYIISPDLHWTGQTGRLNCHDSMGRWGMVDRRGRMLLPCLYDEKPPYTEENGIGYGVLCANYPGKSTFIILARNGRLGIADTGGRVLATYIYDRIRIPYWSSGDSSATFTLYRQGKMGLMNSHYREILPVIYDSV